MEENLTISLDVDITAMLRLTKYTKDSIYVIELCCLSVQIIS